MVLDYSKLKRSGTNPKDYVPMVIHVELFDRFHIIVKELDRVELFLPNSTDSFKPTPDFIGLLVPIQKVEEFVHPKNI